MAVNAMGTHSRCLMSLDCRLADATDAHARDVAA